MERVHGARRALKSSLMGQARRQQAMLVSLHAKINNLAPISMLPLEVLQMIFKFIFHIEWAFEALSNRRPCVAYFLDVRVQSLALGGIELLQLWLWYQLPDSQTFWWEIIWNSENRLLFALVTLMKPYWPSTLSKSDLSKLVWDFDIWSWPSSWIFPWMRTRTGQAQSVWSHAHLFWQISFPQPLDSHWVNHWDDHM